MQKTISTRTGLTRRSMKSWPPPPKPYFVTLRELRYIIVTYCTRPVSLVMVNT